jgi:ApbE superfamily uncharacterized protein (UPF0280 family)
MATTPAQNRDYRSRVHHRDLVSFRTVVQETDLHIQAQRPLEKQALEAVLECRGYLEAYIRQRPEFKTALAPLRIDSPVPAIVAAMNRAASAAGVGPMAAVAGAVAEFVGSALLQHSEQIIVENGGDVYLCTAAPVTMGLYAGKSPMSMRMGFQVGGHGRPTGVCTSSGTVGHSLSLGRADAVCVVSMDCALADAAATAIGNRIRTPEDIPAALEFGRRISGVLGLVAVAGERMGCWGTVELVPLSGKKG